MDISKNYKMYKDAIETARESEQSELVERLLRYFCDENEKECFCACT